MNTGIAVTNLAAAARPRTLRNIVGQQSAVTILKACVSTGRVPSQLLLAGGSGVGKTTLARAFCAAVFCTNPIDGDGCDECDECHDVAAGTHPDVIEVDAASHGGIDQIRDLADKAHFAPFRADRKIYIVDEAHGLSTSGAQAFLKLLEEPPAHTVWILATTDKDKLPAAIQGRCLSLPILAPGRADKLANLGRIAAAHGYTIDAGVLELVVDSADTTLGVRGTVTRLETILPLVATGATNDVIAEALAAADPTHIRTYLNSVTRPDASAAVTVLDTITARAAAPVAFTQIIASTRTQLAAAAADADTAAVSTWLTIWTTLERYPRTVAGLYCATSELLHDRAHADNPAPAGEHPRGQQFTAEAKKPGGAPTPPQPSQSFTVRAQPGDAQPSRRAPTPEAAAHDSRRQRVPILADTLNKIAAINSRAAALGRRCRVTHHGGTSTVHCPAGTDPVLAAALAGILTDITGVTVTASTS